MSADRLNHADTDGPKSRVEIGAVPDENDPAEGAPGKKESSVFVCDSDREDAEWGALDADELRSSDIDAIADYLRESGQAFA